MSGAVSIQDPYQRGNSVVHRMDATTKLLLAVGFILTTSSIPETAWRVSVILLGILLSAVLLSELKFFDLFKRSLLALPFLLAAVPIIFTMPGIERHSFSLLGLTLTVSAAGVNRFLVISFKTWLCVLTAVLLTATTGMTHLLAAMRQLRVPKVLVAAAALMWRYLFVISEEAIRMMHARAARSSRDPEKRNGGSLYWRGKVTGGMAGNLLIRSLERSERVYNAMRSRGYDGEIRLMENETTSPGNALITVTGGFLFVCLLVLGNLWK